MKYVRKTRRGLEVASVTFEHPETGESVTLAGVMHLAHEDFWQTIRGEIEHADARGMVIHVEGTGKAAETRAMTDIVRRAVDNLSRNISITQKFAALTGLIYQTEGMGVYLKTLPRVDMNIVDMVEALPEKRLNRLAERAPENLDALDTPEGQRFVGPVVLFLARNVDRLSLMFRLMPWIDDPMDKSVILDLRNRYAIDAALKETNPSRYLLWGAGHLDGMVKLLRAEGYRLTETTWRIAIPKSHKAPPPEE